MSGFTKIPNRLIDKCITCDCFGYSNGQIFWAVCRKTFGWNKIEDAISISQFVEMTGLSRRSVIYALQDLEAKKILIIKRFDHQINKISLNQEYDLWEVQNLAPQTQKNRAKAILSSAKLRQIKKELVQNSVTTEEELASHEGLGSAKLGTAEFASAKLGKDLVQNSVKSGQSFAPTKETKQKKETKENIPVEKSPGKIKKPEKVPVEKKCNAFGIWIDVNREFGRADPPVIGRDTKAAQQIFAALNDDPEKLKEVYSRFLEDKDKFLLSNGHGLSFLQSRINKYLNDEPEEDDGYNIAQSDLDAAIALCEKDRQDHPEEAAEERRKHDEFMRKKAAWEAVHGKGEPVKKTN